MGKREILICEQKRCARRIKLLIKPAERRRERSEPEKNNNNQRMTIQVVKILEERLTSSKTGMSLGNRKKGNTVITENYYSAFALV